jgi:hypothetical protein
VQSAKGRNNSKSPVDFITRKHEKTVFQAAPLKIRFPIAVYNIRLAGTHSHLITAQAQPTANPAHPTIKLKSICY